MLTVRGILCAALTSAMALAAPLAADAACLPVRTAQDLGAVRGNLAGHYCLLNDLDLAGLKNFSPIGSEVAPFAGSFDGGGHVIRNLTIRSNASRVGLFGLIDGGRVADLTLAGVTIRSGAANALVGAIAGQADNAAVDNVQVTGSVGCTGDICRVGALIGEAERGVTVTLASAAAAVSGGDGGAAGGLMGQTSGRILHSYATGDVVCRSNCAAGGLAGFAGSDSAIVSSFARGTVRGRDNGVAGGLIGTNYGLVSRCYALGDVRVRANAIVAALIGYHGGKVIQSFALGLVWARSNDTAGGLIAALALAQASSRHAYWDVDMTYQGTSAQGQGRTTVQLQAALQNGFDAAWGITPGYGYPFLKSAAYSATLAATTKPYGVFVFLPIQQREPTEYMTPPAHANRAALAAVYTMIARAVGETHHDNRLTGVTIDQYWDDATQTATWSGPATMYASLGGLHSLGNGDKINDSNIVGALKSRAAVILRGHYALANGASVTHWMLATLFTSDAGKTTSLVANDPWTGQQVRIDPATRRVVQPANFPLANFRVDGYRVVALK